MITKEDAHNLMVLLNRVEFTGLAEAEVVLKLVAKLKHIKEEEDGQDASSSAE